MGACLAVVVIIGGGRHEFLSDIYCIHPPESDVQLGFVLGEWGGGKAVSYIRTYVLAVGRGTSSMFMVLDMHSCG